MEHRAILPPIHQSQQQLVRQAQLAGAAKATNLALHRLQHLLEYMRLDAGKTLKLGQLAVFDLFMHLSLTTYERGLLHFR